MNREPVAVDMDALPAYRRIDIDEQGAEWAHRLGAGAKTEMPFLPLDAAVKHRPFRNNTPHATWWQRGFMGAAFTWDVDK